MKMRIATKVALALAALAASLGAPAMAAVTVYTDQQAFLAARSEIEVRPIAAGGLTENDAGFTAGNLSLRGTCTIDTHCLAIAGDRLYVAARDAVRKCSNVIPDVQAFLFDTCLYDYSAGQDLALDGDVFVVQPRPFVSNLDVSSAGSMLGLTFYSPIDGTLDYTVGGAASSIDIGLGNFIGFAGDGPIRVSFSGPIVFAVTAYSAAATVGSVPEPATWAMLILGIGAVGAALRRPRPRSALA